MKPISKIFLVALSEIGTPGTLAGSHGTKILLLKFFSWKVSWVLVVRFGGYWGKKVEFGLLTVISEPLLMKGLL